MDQLSFLRRALLESAQNFTLETIIKPYGPKKVIKIRRDRRLLSKVSESKKSPCHIRVDFENNTFNNALGKSQNLRPGAEIFIFRWSKKVAPVRGQFFYVPPSLNFQVEINVIKPPKIKK